MLRGLLSGGAGSWIRAIEHTVLRIVSLIFSMASAYAIRLFFAPLDAADKGEQVITWLVAVGFGVLGYVVSRGLVHRMMQKESIWAYAPICFLVELVDISCNYVLAASVVGQAWWLRAVPENQRGVLTAATYVVLSVIPLVSLFLAVVDMDLERSKHGGSPGGIGKPLGATLKGSSVVKPLVPPVVRPAGMVNGVKPAGVVNGVKSAGQANGVDPAAAAKRAAYWNGQQGSAGQRKSANPMSVEPDENLLAVN